MVTQAEPSLDLGRDEELRSVRVIRLSPGGEPTLLEPGLSLASPRPVRREVLVAGEWVAIGVSPEKNWAEFYLTVRTVAGETARSDGYDLQAPPLWTTMEPRSLPPLAVRPLLLPDRDVVVEADARLVLLPRTSRGAVPIPVAVIAGDGDGVFRAPGVPAGDYVLRLLSSLAGGAGVAVTLTGKGVEDVEFAPGRSGRGRLVDRSGGHPAGVATVQVVRVPGSAEKSPSPGKKGFDLLDWARETTSDQDGAFRMALPAPGRYRLLALWGDARGSTEFAVPDGTDEVSLGDVLVSTGARVRGTLDGCPVGEVTLTPLPSLDPGSMSVGFFEVRRVPLDGAGRFEAAGLGAGTWVVGARCPRSDVPLEPPLLQVPADGVLVVRLLAEALAAPPAPPS